ncbi:MAG: metal-dependent hydrolase [Chloroflexi bacterium]|nr:metal-dependent hydrolase [Chloroflexota bacterium]
MEGKTHAMIGVAVGLAVAYAHHAPVDKTIVLAAIGGLAGLLPDIDHPQSTIRRGAGVAGNVAFFWLRHRGLTHTLLALVLLGAASAYFMPGSLAMATSVGYVSHLIADMMTRAGLPILWPLSAKSIHLPPGLRTGGWLESVVFLLALGVAVVLGAGYLQ